MTASLPRSASLEVPNNQIAAFSLLRQNYTNVSPVKDAQKNTHTQKRDIAFKQVKEIFLNVVQCFV